MKQKSILILLVLAVALPVFAGPVDMQQLAGAGNVFGFNLLRQISEEQPAANIFISPYSADMALQMVAGGAAGQTKTEMQQVLGTTGLSAATVAEDNKLLTAQFNGGNQDVVLTTANAVWYRQGTTIEPEFIASTRHDFGATIAPLDFSDPRSATRINKWASKQTHGKISQIVDGSPDPATELFLANAVYFKARWADPFKVKDTSDQPFYRRAANPVNIPLMMKTGRFEYCHGTDYQAIRVPYAEDSLAMYVFLPDTNSSPEKLLSVLREDNWRSGFDDQDGTLELPRFKMEYGADLTATLQAMGMNTAFSSGADFSGIAPQVFISAIRQKTFLEVKEEGTEAAAVTIVTMVNGIPAPAPVPFQMIVDRPFLFLIEDSQTSTILFMGIIFNPASN